MFPRYARFKRLISDPAHFSENWGFMSLSPLLGGNLFSLAFGRNLDAHAPKDEQASSSPTPFPTHDRQCLEGRECYASSLYITIAACSVALMLSVWAARRDSRRMKVLEKEPREVVWEITDG